MKIYYNILQNPLLKREPLKKQKLVYKLFLKKNNPNGINMFNKILIANRGEIACRIIKTIKKWA